MRPIAISLSPNTQKDDISKALAVLFSPWSWFDDKKVNDLENDFANKLGGLALAVNSGRSAEYLILKALGISKYDEVIVQAFTCVAVPNSVLWLGAKPVYVDVDKSYNLDIDDLKKKVTNKTKAIIVQHTFGIPANIDEIKKFASKKNLYILEDCAHSLGAQHKGKLLGSFGDAAFFSFGRDKVISSVFGGMIVTKDERLYEKIKNERNSLGNNSFFWVFQQLIHPVVFNIFVLPLYNLGFGKYGLGKMLLFVFQKLGLLSKPVYEIEKNGKRPKYFPKQMSGALSDLAQQQLTKLNNFNKQRKIIANYYLNNINSEYIKLPSKNKEAIWLRFPIKTKFSNELFDYLKSQKILVGNWYSNIIDPKCDLNKFGYNKTSSPRAELFVSETLNLPTYPLMSTDDAKKVVDLLNRWKPTK